MWYLTIPILMLMLSTAPFLPAASTLQYPYIAKWRGFHGHAVGLCTAELIAPHFVMTAGHCAVRVLHNETVSVKVTFENTNASAPISRGIVACHHAPQDEDLAVCKLDKPISTHTIQPIAMAASVYTTVLACQGSVMCVGTYHGLHATGPKTLEYEASGAKLYVNNSNGSGMHAGDSGGAWVTIDPHHNRHVLVGVIHGGAGKGLARKGVAVQPSFVRSFIDHTTNDTATWVASATDIEIENSRNTQEAQLAQLAQLAPPEWGGAASFSARVNLTAHDVVASGASWWFNYSYLSNTTTNSTWSRYDHEDGQRDEVCNGIKKNTPQKCTTVHASDGWMYVAFPESKECCKCSKHIGPVRSDWLQDGGASYVGRTQVDNTVVDEWLKQGASDNHYYSTPALSTPVRYMEHKNGKRKSWDFQTYLNKTVDGGVFEPPPNCQNRCLAALCLF